MSNHDRESYRQCAYQEADRRHRYETAAGIVAACALCFFVGFMVGGRV